MRMNSGSRRPLTDSKIISNEELVKLFEESHPTTVIERDMLARRLVFFSGLPEAFRRVGEQYIHLCAVLVEGGLTPAARELVDRAIPAAIHTVGVNTERPPVKAEANALTAYCLRSGPLEEIQASGRPIDHKEVRRIVTFARRRVEGWLHVRDVALREAPDVWWAWVNANHKIYRRGWSKYDDKDGGLDFD